MSAVPPVKNRQLYIDGKWCDAASGQEARRHQPGHRRDHRRGRFGGRADCGARRRGGGRGAAGVDEAHRLRPRQGAQEDRRPDARTGRRPRPHADDGAGQAARRGEGRGAALRRHLRVVRRGGQAGLRAGHPAVDAGQAAHDDQAPGRRRRRDRPVELPDHAASAQDRPGARRRLHDRLQAREPDAAVAHRRVRVPDRRRLAAGRREPRDRLRRARSPTSSWRTRRCGRSASPARPRSASN